MGCSGPPGQLAATEGRENTFAFHGSAFHLFIYLFIIFQRVCPLFSNPKPCPHGLGKAARKGNWPPWNGDINRYINRCSRQSHPLASPYFHLAACLNYSPGPRSDAWLPQLRLTWHCRPCARRQPRHAPLQGPGIRQPLHLEFGGKASPYCCPRSPPVTNLGAADCLSTGTLALPSSAALVPAVAESRAAFPSHYGSQQALLCSLKFSTLQGGAEQFTVVVEVGFGH